MRIFFYFSTISNKLSWSSNRPTSSNLIDLEKFFLYLILFLSLPLCLIFFLYLLFFLYVLYFFIFFHSLLPLVFWFSFFTPFLFYYDSNEYVPLFILKNLHQTLLHYHDYFSIYCFHHVVTFSIEKYRCYYLCLSFFVLMPLTFLPLYQFLILGFH